MVRKWLILCLVVGSGCAAGVDKQRFDPVYRAGKALQVEVHSIGSFSIKGGDDLEKQFKTEVAALDGRTKGQKEIDAAAAYKAAAAAFEDYLRFRFLALEAIDGKILLMGTNIEAAKRYGPYLEKNTPDSALVDSNLILKTSLDVAESKLEEANQIVNGTK